MKENILPVTKYFITEYNVTDIIRRLNRYQISLEEMWNYMNILYGLFNTWLFHTWLFNTPN